MGRCLSFRAKRLVIGSLLAVVLLSWFLWLVLIESGSFQVRLFDDDDLSG